MNDQSTSIIAALTALGLVATALFMAGRNRDEAKKLDKEIEDTEKELKDILDNKGNYDHAMELVKTLQGKCKRRVKLEYALTGDKEAQDKVLAKIDAEAATYRRKVTIYKLFKERDALFSAFKEQLLNDLDAAYATFRNWKRVNVKLIDLIHPEDEDAAAHQDALEKFEEKAKQMNDYIKAGRASLA